MQFLYILQAIHIPIKHPVVVPIHQFHPYPVPILIQQMDNTTSTSSNALGGSPVNPANSASLWPTTLSLGQDSIGNSISANDDANLRLSLDHQELSSQQWQ